MENYKADVDGVLESFQSLVVPLDQEEQAKAQVCREVAWRIAQRNPNIGLLRKDSGNAVNGRSVDVLIDRSDGSSVDAITAKLNTPRRGQCTIASAWTAYEATDDPDWNARWLEVTEAIAREPGPLQKWEPAQPAEPEERPAEGPALDMPPMPTEWSKADRLSLEWYSEAGLALDAVYCNVLTPPGATELRHADPGGWGNWWFHIVEEAWTVPQIVDAMTESDEYKAAHP